MVLNLAWTPIFFKAHRTDLALADAAAMLGVAAAATVSMSKVCSQMQGRRILHGYIHMWSTLVSVPI